MKKILSLAFAVLMIFLSVPFSTSAKATFLSEDVEVENVGDYEEILSEYVDYDSFCEMVRSTISSCGKIINVSSYNIHYESDFFEGLRELIRYGMPEYFHVDSLVQWRYSESVAYYEVKYLYTAEEYEQMKDEFDKASEELLSGVKGNNSLSDVEKALILHDRLALKMEYDYTYTNRDAYQAIVNGNGVCEGYTRAYTYLLNQVGIKNENCLSNDLNHIWNIVYIDEIPYHVDVTWDDVSWETGERGIIGLVQHENFLRSTDGMIATNHKATDYNSTPTDTTYDSYFWQESEAAFVLLNNEIYFIDGNTSELKRYSDMAVLASTYDIWWASQNSVWGFNFSRLATDGKYLYYSMADAVYRYDVEKEISEKIFEPELSGYNSIYGMEYSDRYIVCDINTAPPYGGGTSLDQSKYFVSEEKEEAVVIKSSSCLSSDGEFLNGIKHKTAVSDALAELENKDAVITDKDGNVLSDSDFCATGCKVVLAYNGEVIDSLEVVVLGDVDGSGIVDSTDYMIIKSMFIGESSLSGVYLSAADVSSNNIVNMTDYLRVKSFFLGVYELYA